MKSQSEATTKKKYIHKSWKSYILSRRRVFHFKHDGDLAFRDVIVAHFEREYLTTSQTTNEVPSVCSSSEKH